MERHQNLREVSVNTPVTVDFPLRGEWFAPNTPGTKIPSHGTDVLGQRYAFDFVGTDPQGHDFRFYRRSPLHYLLFGVRLEECFGWGRPIYSATNGKVIQAEDGLPERDPVNLSRDLAFARENAQALNTNQALDYHSLAGNFIIVESSEGYAVYAHAQTGSIRVSAGEVVSAGQQLANVGHSGNSTAPHLHFQLMDSPDPWKAGGILCCFREYEVYSKSGWLVVQNGIPKASELIRRG